MSVRNYIVDISSDRRGERFTASMPRLGLVAQGRSAEAAVTAVRRAAREWIAEARQAGIDVPPPEDLKALVMQHKPRIEISWSEEDRTFFASSPDVPGCITDGETYEKALKLVLEAIGLHLSTCDSAETAEPRAQALTA